MSTNELIAASIFVLVASAAFGYLPARTAARKGYSLRWFWVFGTLFLLPTVVVAQLLKPKPGMSNHYRG